MLDNGIHEPCNDKAGGAQRLYNETKVDTANPPDALFGELHITAFSSLSVFWAEIVCSACADNLPLLVPQK